MEFSTPQELDSLPDVMETLNQLESEGKLDPKCAGEEDLTSANPHEVTGQVQQNSSTIPNSGNIATSAAQGDESGPESPIREPMKTFLGSGTGYDLVGSPQGGTSASNTDNIIGTANTGEDKIAVLDKEDRATEDTDNSNSGLKTQIIMESNAVSASSALGNTTHSNKVPNGHAMMAQGNNGKVQIASTSSGYAAMPAIKPNHGRVNNATAADMEITAGRIGDNWRNYDSTKPGFGDNRTRLHVQWNGYEDIQQFEVKRDKSVLLHLRRPVGQAVLWVTHRDPDFWKHAINACANKEHRHPSSKIFWRS